MSRIAILGAGRVASSLAKLATRGHDVTIGVRRLDALPDWVIPPLKAASVSEAASKAEVVFNATPGASTLELMTELRADLGGKTLVDVSNAVERHPDGMPGTLIYPNSSLAENLQAALPNTQVVKTLNTMIYTVMADPGSLKGANVFVSGDQAEAKSTVISLLGDIGWDDDAIIDLGDVRTARGPEAMILFVTDLMKAWGFKPLALSVAT